jgi:hypothetical protein
MKHVVVLILLIIFICDIKGQNNVQILDRKVTIKITNQPLGKVLNIISETADFNFSYSSQLVKVNKLVTILAENRTVKEVLDQLFNHEFTYQQIGNHLVLQKKIVPRTTGKAQTGDVKPSKYYYVVSGYLRDASTGNGIANVSVYEKQSLSTTLSGDFGYYQFSLTSKSPELTLYVRGQGYRDTSIHIVYDNHGVVSANINLENLFSMVNEEPLQNSDSLPQLTPEKPMVIADSASRLVWQDSSENSLPVKRIKVEETQMGKWFINKYQRINELNIRDSFQRDWQATFIPPLGTNGVLSGFVTNSVSLNALVGYNGGVNGMEFGGLVNIIKGNVVGAQFGGLGNIVGGNVEGAQFAGLANSNLGSFNGFQAGGLSNHNIGSFSGFQAAGIYNYNNAWSEGFQAAGLLNINRGAVNGFQVAGVGNYAGKLSNAVQVAGVFNMANHLDGGQIGVINIARKIRGFQIGIVNIADSSEGIAIGIVNFIKNGTHQLEMSLNELNQYGLAYRSGTDKFYSNVMVTTRLPMLPANTLMSYGFGIGTAFKLSNTFKITADLASLQQSFNFRSEGLNLLNRFNANIEVKIIKGLAVFGGASLNHLIADKRDSHYEGTFKNFGGKDIWSYDDTVYKQHAWIGYQFGLRVF